MSNFRLVKNILSNSGEFILQEEIDGEWIWEAGFAKEEDAKAAFSALIHNKGIKYTVIAQFHAKD